MKTANHPFLGHYGKVERLFGSHQARNRARGVGGFDSPKRQHRRQFKGVLNDCLRLAESLGVPCVRQVYISIFVAKIMFKTR